MERLPRSFYTHAFKEEAVSLVLTGGLSVAEEPSTQFIRADVA